MNINFSDMYKGLIFKRHSPKDWLVYYLVLYKDWEKAELFWVRQKDNIYNIITHKPWIGSNLDHASKKITRDDRRNMIRLIMNEKLSRL